jgi:hypothetical protein
VLLAGSVLLAASTVRSAAAAGRSTRRRPYRVFVLTQYLANVALACVIA